MSPEEFRGHVEPIARDVARAEIAAAKSERGDVMSVIVGALKSKSVRFSAIVGAAIAMGPELQELYATTIQPAIPPEAHAVVVRATGLAIGIWGIYTRFRTTTALAVRGRKPKREPV